MKEMNEVESRFFSELLDLLDKWQVELSAADHYPGYSECGEDIQINFSASAIYDSQGNKLRDEIDLDVGTLVLPRPRRRDE